MKKVILITLGVIAAIVMTFVVVVAMQPTDFNVTRSATIPAPPPVVFEQINTLPKWQAWSPWARLDPNAKNTFAGPESGKGAKFSWAGNDQVGEGTMTITESRPNEFIKMLLEFKKPMEDNCDITFAFKPASDGTATNVTWSMLGKNNFMGKAMCMFMDMDTMVGGDFEKGFANLQEVIEKEQTSDATTPTETPAEEATIAG